MAIPDNVKQYTAVFASPLAIWTINHGLGFKPVVQLLIDDGDIDYEYVKGIAETTVSNTQIIINFGNYTPTGRVTYG